MHCHDRKGPPGHKCKGKEDCPLSLEHPPNGSNKAFAVGCGLCRELKIKNADFDEQMKKQQEKLDEIKNKYKDF